MTIARVFVRLAEIGLFWLVVNRFLCRVWARHGIVIIDGLALVLVVTGARPQLSFVET